MRLPGCCLLVVFDLGLSSLLEREKEAAERERRACRSRPSVLLSVGQSLNIARSEAACTTTRIGAMCVPPRWLITAGPSVRAPEGIDVRSCGPLDPGVAQRGARGRGHGGTRRGNTATGGGRGSQTRPERAYLTRADGRLLYLPQLHGSGAGPDRSEEHTSELQ